MGGAVSNFFKDTGNMFSDFARDTTETVINPVIDTAVDFAKDTTETVVNPVIDTAVDFVKDTTETVINPIIDTGIYSMIGSAAKGMADSVGGSSASGIATAAGGGALAAGLNVFEEEVTKKKGIKKRAVGTKGAQIPLAATTSTTTPSSGGVQI